MLSATVIAENLAGYLYINTLPTRISQSSTETGST